MDSQCCLHETHMESTWMLSHVDSATMGCSRLGSSVHVSQARILEWIAIFYSRGSSGHRDPTHVSCVSCIDRWIFYNYPKLLISPPPSPSCLETTSLFSMSVSLFHKVHLCHILDSTYK